MTGHTQLLQTTIILQPPCIMDSTPYTPPSANRTSDRAFGWFFATVCAVVSLYPVFMGHPLRPGWLSGAAALAVVATAKPSIPRLKSTASTATRIFM